MAYPALPTMSPINMTRTLMNQTIWTNMTKTKINATSKLPLQNEKTLPPFEVIILVMCVPCFIAAVIGNSLVIMVRVKALKRVGLSAYKLLICNLSLADIIYSTAIPLDIYTKIHHTSWIQSGAVCKVFLTTQSASLTASIGIMTAMAFERFQGVSDPLRHHWSTKKVMILTVLIWVYSYSNFIPYAMALDVQDGTCADHHYSSAAFAKWYTLYQFISSWLAPLMMIMCFHFGMVLKVVTHRRSIRKSTYHAKSHTSRSHAETAKIQNRKMVKILIVIVMMFAVLTLPIHIWFLLYEFSERSVTASYDLKVVEVFATLVYLHCAANPIIYSVMDRQFRDDVKGMFRIGPQRQDEIPMRTMNDDTLATS